ncbi:hypothetical protein P6F26_02495 [Roseibacterium sp. SDUM158017]|uniref:DUF7282 domain-containing protein n=1 Tax=Roseicyclus salinarum TaxID=3036773 RepID=UPI0024157A7A|nr:hypothetical protein [Roseibacterium sp. SDUM158017]MDG4647301.1 hypothetical protein [Roseibacterium sp. SDUM158017]
MIRITACAAAALLAAPAALAQDTQPAIGEARHQDGGIVLDNVVAETPGYIVVTEDTPEGAPASAPVAIAEVPAGETRDVIVRGDFMPGGRYIVMLYEETGEEGFQYREGIADLPVSREGEHVLTTFEMMMEAGETGSDG